MTDIRNRKPCRRNLHKSMMMQMGWMQKPLGKIWTTKGTNPNQNFPEKYLLKAWKMSWKRRRKERKGQREIHQNLHPRKYRKNHRYQVKMPSRKKTGKRLPTTMLRSSASRS